MMGKRRNRRAKTNSQANDIGRIQFIPSDDTNKYMWKSIVHYGDQKCGNTKKIQVTVSSLSGLFENLREIENRIRK